jgi:hypothetical protein
MFQPPNGIKSDLAESRPLPSQQLTYKFMYTRPPRHRIIIPKQKCVLKVEHDFESSWTLLRGSGPRLVEDGRRNGLNTLPWAELALDFFGAGLGRVGSLIGAGRFWDLGSPNRWILISSGPAIHAAFHNCISNRFVFLDLFLHLCTILSHAWQR